jgi:hypothetical protein
LAETWLGGLPGERFHLACHHGKAAAGSPGAGRLDGGIERKQVALSEDFGTLTPILQDLSDVSKTLLISARILYNVLTRDGQNLLHFVRHIGWHHRQNEG